ncbi:MAG TPA: lipase family protein [Bryobacteraceae bacterium]|nr:lipase family protein [Bryobacteraceae bacterium]
MAQILFPAGFDLPTALEAAELVAQAYAQFDAFKKSMKWSLPAAYRNLATFSAKAEPFGFVAQNSASRNVFVTFRGTETLEDWLSNITIRHTNHAWGPVEEGFWNLYAQCQENVRAGVQAAAEAGQIVVTGHSLGGALATLAAADLTISGVAVKMYNFASPRTGSPAFAEQFNQRIAAAWRAVNTEDLVPTVPISTPNLEPGKSAHGLLGVLIGIAPKLDFEHVGIPVNFTTFKGSISANHQMETYVAALSEAKAAAI